MVELGIAAMRSDEAHLSSARCSSVRCGNSPSSSAVPTNSAETSPRGLPTAVSRSSWHKRSKARRSKSLLLNNSTSVCTSSRRGLPARKGAGEPTIEGREPAVSGPIWSMTLALTSHFSLLVAAARMPIAKPSRAQPPTSFAPARSGRLGVMDPRTFMASGFPRWAGTLARGVGGGARLAAVAQHE